MTVFSRRIVLLAPAAVLFLAAALFMGVTPARADAPAAFIQKLGDVALTELTGKDVSAAEREKRVRDLLRRNFDVQTIGRFALGTYWPQATAAERKEYLKLFEDMIVKTYAQRFGEYAGQTFKVNKSKPLNKRDTIVPSQVLETGAPPLNIEWRVRNVDGSIKIIDVIIENVSMATTQRSDFSAVIQRSGGKVEGLLKSLRERSAQ